jgi:hypothetical protein
MATTPQEVPTHRVRSGEESPALSEKQIDDVRKLIGVWLRRDVHTPAIYEPLSVHDILRWARYSVGDDNTLFSEVDYAGIASELEADAAWVALPSTPDRVRAAIAPLKLATLLKGFRGRAPANIDALLAAACSLGDCYLAVQPAVRELELNPVFVHEIGSGSVVAVDALGENMNAQF